MDPLLQSLRIDFGEEWICLECKQFFQKNPGASCPSCHGAICVRIKMPGK